MYPFFSRSRVLFVPFSAGLMLLATEVNKHSVCFRSTLRPSALRLQKACATVDATAGKATAGKSRRNWRPIPTDNCASAIRPLTMFASGQNIAAWKGIAQVCCCSRPRSMIPASCDVGGNTAQCRMLHGCFSVDIVFAERIGNATIVLCCRGARMGARM